MLRSDSPRWLRSTLLVLTAAMLVSRLWSIGHRNLDDDEYEHAHAAWLVSQGETPYADFFEHHTPALYLLTAPLFGMTPVATDADAAIRALVTARGVMWLLTIGAVALIYAIGRQWHNGTTGIVAVTLAATASRFLDTMLEFRPDVPAVVCLLMMFAALLRASRSTHRHAAWYACAGAAYAASVLFTPKVLFASPGLAIALAIDRRRWMALTAFAAGGIAPIAIVVAWFAARHAVGALVLHTVMTNARLNADSLPPFRRFGSQLLQQPALFGFGIAGMIDVLRRGRTAPHRVPVVASAAAFIAGIFLIGRANDEYYVLLLPLLAAPAALAAQRLRPSAIVAGSALLVAVAVGNDLRRFHPIAPQLADIRWVTAQTAAGETYLGATPGAALFRPAAWFYFFLSGPFASSAEYADLVAKLESGMLRPRLAILAADWSRAPAPLMAYIRTHYRPVDGHPAVWSRSD